MIFEHWRQNNSNHLFSICNFVVKEEDGTETVIFPC